MLPRRARKNESPEGMSRHEAAVWLGRAMSTNEVTLRVTLELLDIVAFQQAALQELYTASKTTAGNGQPAASEDIAVQFDQDISHRIVEKVTQLRAELDPVLKVVGDSCQRLEEIIKAHQQ